MKTFLVSVDGLRYLGARGNSIPAPIGVVRASSLAKAAEMLEGETLQQDNVEGWAVIRCQTPPFPPLSNSEEIYRIAEIPCREANPTHHQ